MKAIIRNGGLYWKSPDVKNDQGQYKPFVVKIRLYNVHQLTAEGKISTVLAQSPNVLSFAINMSTRGVRAYTVHYKNGGVKMTQVMSTLFFHGVHIGRVAQYEHQWCRF